MHTTALVLFSGGQDSTTCLAHALERYERVETLGFDCGQRHSAEMQARSVVLARLRERFPDWEPFLGQDHVLSLDVLRQISSASLTEGAAAALQGDGPVNAFVPGRNLLFLTLAGALAYQRGLQVLVTGICETDFSGYPDCRDDTVKAMQVALNLGLAQRLRIETPLMWIDKAATWQLAETLGGAALVDLIVQDTHTCYESERGQRHDWGYGCGQCPACALRARGWAGYRGQEAGAA